MAELRSDSLPPDVNRGPMIVGISWASASLAIVAVALRISIRFKKRAHGWDDYVIYTALVSVSSSPLYITLITSTQAMSIYGAILNTLQVKYGFGRHIEYVLATLPRVAMYTTLVEMQNAIGTFLVKFSVCLFILRLIRRTYRKVRIVLWLTIFILFVLTITTLLVLGLQCIPFQKIWNREMPGSCFSASVLTQLIRILGGK